MNRKIITYGGYFESFMKTLSEKEKSKIEYGLMLLETQHKVSAKYVGYIDDGLFELRVEYNGNIYRLFFIFDNDNIVVLFNGFQKKTQKTPRNEIEKALKIRSEYYENKGTSKQS
jgi:putative addiction module killer protein